MLKGDPVMICPACFQETLENGICSSCGFDENAPQSPLLLPPGTPLMNGQYLVGKILGKPGGFGITYLGWDSQLATFVAIKEYLPRDIAGRHFDRLTVSAHTSADSEHFRYGMEQFLQDARTGAVLHPNVVCAPHLRSENGTAYLVMDYLQGNSLYDHLAKWRRMTDRRAGNDRPLLDGFAGGPSERLFASGYQTTEYIYHHRRPHDPAGLRYGPAGAWRTESRNDHDPDSWLRTLGAIPPARQARRLDRYLRLCGNFVPRRDRHGPPEPRSGVAQDTLQPPVFLAPGLSPLSARDHGRIRSIRRTARIRWPNSRPR
jgi:hypothetical protein